ncbi:glycosyl hydrolase family 61-domain-containing protein [Truncatella angustata]|uniref:lytic cellulose monooxygenase (C4-dehydrogenating) n=1 Tax=Truncatella angustata TaxID=152316 RepID=A0A9P8RNQ7_9PEZI|nr:glycosyl hydrolase family 61-domain-containing protein [Truncatella angustata]KAH6647373.1 glycosyl hydrolase family 61-domain-containing protein [Truncatella angustata]
MHSLSSIGLALAGAVTVSAHSYVLDIDVDLKTYPGFRPMNGSENAPVIVGWNTSAWDMGWIGEDSYATPDIVCHKNAENAQGYAPVAAGDKVHIQWNGWPEGHKGPVVDYLASCGDEGCESVDKTTLEFFKINQGGLINSSAMAPYGEWASDQLIANNNSWLVEIPSSVKPGFYVLRTEIIALHNLTTGAQHYPQCLNLEITGNGTELPVGILGEHLYNSTQPGLDRSLNVTTGVTSYLVPGPTLIPDAVSIPLSNPVPTGTGSIITATASVSAIASKTATSPSKTVHIVTVTVTATPGVKRGNGGSLFARTTERAHVDERRWYHQGLGF